MVGVNFQEELCEEQDVDEAVVEDNSTEDNHLGLVFVNIQEVTDDKREIIEEINSIIEHNLEVELQGFKEVERTSLRKHVKKDDDRIALECYYSSEPRCNGYRERIDSVWISRVDEDVAHEEKNVIERLSGISKKDRVRLPSFRGIEKGKL
eukprot:gene6460-11908_t